MRQKKGNCCVPIFKDSKSDDKMNTCYLLSRDKRHLIRLRNTAIVSESKIIERCIINEMGQEALADAELTLD